MQAVEEVLPVDGLYVPAAQAVQADWPDVLYDPAGQVTQAVEELLPADGLYVPAGQARQVACPNVL